MSRRWLAFDLEIAALDLDDGGDWKARRPLGITCAAWATASQSSISTVTFCGKGDGLQINPAPRMTRRECQVLVFDLVGMAEKGYTLLTHNGCSFDLDILAEESGMHAECVELAMNSIDSCLYVHCVKGYPVGIDAICRGMGIKGKLEGINGAVAPAMWANGQYQEVLDYCANDAKITLEVALAVERTGYLHWIARSGKLNAMRVERWLTVRECLQLREPDTSWMSGERLTRSKFTEWMRANQPT